MEVKKDVRGYDIIEWESVLNGWTESVDRLRIEGGWIYRYGKLDCAANKTVYTTCFSPAQEQCDPTTCSNTRSEYHECPWCEEANEIAEDDLVDCKTLLCAECSSLFEVRDHGCDGFELVKP